MADIKYERESDTPVDWKTNTILQRNAAGDVIEIAVPDDDAIPEEAKGDAGDD